MRIQDIITGDVGSHNESALAEIIRVAKLQGREKKDKAVVYCGLIMAMLCCIISGGTVFCNIGNVMNNHLLFDKYAMLMYAGLMLITFIMILAGYVSRMGTHKNAANKLCRYMKIASLFSLIWSILVTSCVCFLAIMGRTPFEIGTASVGIFINLQLIGLYILNLAIVFVEIYRFQKDEAISPTIFIATATIYTTVLYSDMLHGLDLEQELIENLLTRTLVVLVFVGIFLLVARKIEVKASK